MSTMTAPTIWEAHEPAGGSLDVDSASRRAERRPSLAAGELAPGTEIPVSETATLVLAAQQGDREALGDLFQRYEGQVMAVALRRLQNHGEAQELCQDVFVQVMLKIGQLREPDAFGGWLRAITQRMAVNRLTRQRSVQGMDPESLESQWGDDMTPDQLALAAERKESVRAGLSRLGRLDRETLVAFYVEGQSLLEMSDEFGAPLGTIKRRLHVARKRLAKQMESLVAI